MDRYQELFHENRFVDQPSFIFGLYRELYFENKQRNKQEAFPPDANVNTPEHFTAKNQQVLRRVLEWSQPKRILEIGVFKPRRPKDRSSTTTIFEYMGPGTNYLGVDKVKKNTDSFPDNAHFLQCQSNERDTVLSELRDLGMSELDLIFIDGFKSVECTYNDWAYADMLRTGGWVVMHDTSWHAGPILLWDCIEQSIFTKFRWENGNKDYGVGAFQRRI
jgi:hypothetical protein